MITLNGKKMGKSYGNQIRLTEMFTGHHPQLRQAYSPMTIRFFILQTHYRSTLDFSNDALQAAEKGLKRLWEAYELLKKPSFDPANSTPPGDPGPAANSSTAGDPTLDDKVRRQLLSLDDFMNDDFNTAKVLATLFDLVPVINSLKSGHLPPGSLSPATMSLHKKVFYRLPGKYSGTER